MPYKVYKTGGRYCVHKENADGSKGKRMGCHDSPGKARAQQKALYASEERPMSKAKRVKEKKRREKRAFEIQKEQELEEELELENEAALLEELEEEETSEAGGEALEKSYFGGEYEENASIGGPLTFEQMDEMRAADERAHEIREATYDVQTLVRNIVNAPMLEPQEKATYIKSVGNEFGSRVAAIMDTPTEMLKESSLEALEIEAVLAQDERNTGFIEKAVGFFQKKDLSSQAREALPDSDFALPEKRKYPIHDKAHVRNALARAAQMIKQGGEAAEDAKKALPKIRAAAKKFGIETSMEKGKSGIIIQKDAQGDWRWVGWPSNNFIDRSKDILTEAAHLEYVDWWNKNKDDIGFPVFTSMHAPGTARTYPVDFVGYENGFLVMSGKLNKDEAAGLLRVQKEYDLGMSQTGWGVRDKEDPRQIVRYRIYEVTDLPVEMADNPFTDLAVLSKEADMNKQEQLAYLTTLMGDEKIAKEALSAKTEQKQAELQELGIEQKQAKETPEAETPTAETTPPEFDVLMEKISKELDIEGLNEFVVLAKESMEKVPMLERIIKAQQEQIVKLGAESDEQLAEMISPKVGPKFSWSKRASESDETVIEGEELEKAKKKVPGIPDGEDWWLSNDLGVTPVMAEE